MALPSSLISGKASSMSSIRDAPFPFNDASADVIFRSSDGVDFRALKAILSIASPFFKDMFTLPQPSTHSPDTFTGDVYRDGILVIPLTEDSEILDFILRSCYPVRSPRITRLNHIRAVLVASRKYQIEALEGVGEEELWKIMDTDPIGVYTIAVRFGLREVATKAARASLRHPLLTFSDGLSGITCEQYFALLKYRDDCGIAAAAVTQSRTWLDQCFNTLRWKCHTYGRPDGLDDCYVKDTISSKNSGWDWFAPPILWAFLTQAGVGLRSRPHGSWLTDDLEWEEQVPRWSAAKCKHSGSSFGQGMTKFRQLLAEEVERVVDEIAGPQN
ncbi:uncharacterized protein STEHIDRAFT_159505 [Stereum hirsutum FP-91666 SS1]|uniref:uncharacterized protein n=1 Tax=Stereum hirsutum (strain FP-91666) TaxID=721885 RepID=UPI0004449859|nr:uncharacterized protein STEHIDRAFT_159505 [Stereum hirsutum FP-91666 SS1]EIM83890.1 hypothetical protein STEHIDRAFT_159505 [Stereum hirsutum FP-91666 SS1]